MEGKETGTERAAGQRERGKGLTGVMMGSRTDSGPRASMQEEKWVEQN